MAMDKAPRSRRDSDSVSRRDPEHRSLVDQEREERFAIIDRMREAFADVSTEEIEREVARAVAEVRAEMEAERMRSGQDEPSA